MQHMMIVSTINIAVKIVLTTRMFIFSLSSLVRIAIIGNNVTASDTPDVMPIAVSLVVELHNNEASSPSKAATAIAIIAGIKFSFIVINY